MPARQSIPAGSPCWIDLITADVDASRAFYTQLLGWVAEEPNEEFGGYFSFSKDEALVAGCMAQRDGDAMVPDAWTVYLAVDDAAKTVEAAEGAGGKVHMPVMPIADIGTMAILEDPSGAAFGIWQPGEHTGFGVVAEPNTPGWFELHTKDYDAAVGFYRDVLGWDAVTAQDTPTFRYTTLHEGDDAEAGIMDAKSFLPEGAPSHWKVYFTVEDVDATLAKALELGGTIVMPAEDTPYGRLAVANDSTGASFSLRGPNKG
jgi:predicted enzyme related to lactoylglutathione lyase